MLSVVCWRWKPHDGYRSTFEPFTVNVLRSMVRRHYSHPHRFICVTDDPKGLDPDIEIVPLWDDFAKVRNPYGAKHPSCYRRLRAFSAEIADIFGPRFVSIDLDCVITGDLTPLWHRSEDFVMWGETNPKTPYNGSMFLMTAGARRQVWERFDPTTSPTLARNAGCFGSDQGWISYVLGPREARWTRADGVYSFRNDLQLTHQKTLPAGARVVFFHGRYDPWHEYVQTTYPWTKEHWR